MEKNTKNEENYFVGHYRHNYIKVPFEDIMYIANNKRGSKVFVNPYSKAKDFKFPILIDVKIDEAYKTLEKYDFVYGSSSYLINLNYVQELDLTEIKLVYEGEKLTVSRKYYKKFKKRFLEMGVQPSN